jgi:hypothetical protein
MAFEGAGIFGFPGLMADNFAVERKSLEHDVEALAILVGEEIEQAMQRGPAPFQFAAFDARELVLRLAVCGLT